jgi:dipeptidyl aminopeptidase/acylaminoacyl peptidase
MIEGVRQADWSPRGDDLAIIRDVAGKDRLEYPIGKVLYEVAGYLSDPRFSPEGDRIAFFEHPYKYDDRGSVNVVDLSGKVTMLSDGYWGLEGLVWTREGDEILFSAGTGYSNWAVYGVSPSSRKVRPALQSAGGITIHDITPSGRWLVTRDDIKRWTHGRAPGEERERDLSWLELSEPKALTPDGRTLLFTESGMAAGVNYAVCLRKTDGSPVIRLGEGGAEDLSPDGRWALSIIHSTPPQAILYPTGPGEPRKLDRGTIENYQGGFWFRDGRRVLFGASEPDRAQRCYEQEVDGGPPRPVTPEGTDHCKPGPDGRGVLARSAEGDWNFHPVSGGAPVPVAGIEPDEVVSRFSRDGRSIIVVRERTVPAQVTRVELDGGRRTLLKEIAPEDLAGVLSIASFVTNDDETAYAYCNLRYTAELFLVDGAR